MKVIDENSDVIINSLTNAIAFAVNFPYPKWSQSDRHIENRFPFPSGFGTETSNLLSPPLFVPLVQE